MVVRMKYLVSYNYDYADKHQVFDTEAQLEAWLRDQFDIRDHYPWRSAAFEAQIQYDDDWKALQFFQIGDDGSIEKFDLTFIERCTVLRIPNRILNRKGKGGIAFTADEMKEIHWHTSFPGDGRFELAPPADFKPDDTCEIRNALLERLRKARVTEVNLQWSGTNFVYTELEILPAQRGITNEFKEDLKDYLIGYVPDGTQHFGSAGGSIQWNPETNVIKACQGHDFDMIDEDTTWH